MIVYFPQDEGDTNKVFVRADKVNALRYAPTGKGYIGVELLIEGGGSTVVRGKVEEIMEVLAKALPDVWKVDPYQDASEGH